MNDAEKVTEYEMQIEDMMNAFQERINELESKKNLSEFEQGRLLGYTEVVDIIKTRHQMIIDVLNDE